MGQSVAFVLASFACVGLLGFADPAQTPSGPPTPASTQQPQGRSEPNRSAAATSSDFHSSVVPLLSGSCIQCHNATTLSGDLNLQRLVPASDDAAMNDCDILEAVAGRLEAGTMPPRGKPRPPTGEVALATGWIHHACAGGENETSKSVAGPAPSQHVLAAAPGAETASSPHQETAASLTSGDAFETAVKPMIRTSCGACHNAAAMTADLDLTRFLHQSSEDVFQERDLWEEVARRVGAQQMPPPGKPRLDPQTISSVTHWIEQQSARLDEDAAPDPGSVTARRLNRHEYNNTVRDLLGVNLNVSGDFPPDPYAYGFDNIGEALSLSPSLTEMYLKTAQRIARTAIPLETPRGAISTRYDAAAIGQRNHMHIQTVHEFPVDAEYNLRAAWDQAVPRGTVMTGHIFVDGKEVLKQTFAFATSQERAVTALKVPVTQGSHKLEVLMEIAPDSQQPKPFRGNLPYPTWLEVIGPYNPLPFPQTASYLHIFFKGPPRPGQQDAYTRQIMERLAYRAYRRPPTKMEVDRLISLTHFVRERGGDFYKQIQIALEGILMSPNFLFRIERDAPGSGAHRVNDYELASRLSYFLWSSMPDDQLLTLAGRQELRDPAILHAQVRRMLADSRAGALAVNFSGQWLQTQNLDFDMPDAKVFPQFDAELRDAMQMETRMFFTSVITEDRSILDFLNGKYTFLNERLARFYGIPGVTGPQFRRVSLEGTERGGILTQASVLTATSYPTRTSPTVRGKWILTNILNTPPPEPPANVPSLASATAEGNVTSIRERLNMHRANPVCASCHSGMDPLGFALENYNAIGEWRQTADGLPVDASGQLPDGTAFTGAAQLQTVLLKQSAKFINCLTERLLTYSLGRGLNAKDRPAVRRIEREVTGDGSRFSALVFAIVDSAPFQMRRPQDPAPAVAAHVALAAQPTLTHEPRRK